MIRFVRKDKIDIELEEALLTAVSKYNYHNEICVFKTKDKDEIAVSLSEIIFFELVQRYIHLHTIKSAYTLTTGKISEYEKLFSDKGFVLICRSYLVNLKFIERFSARSVILSCGKEISLGKNKDRINEVKDRFYLYKMK